MVRARWHHLRRCSYPRLVSICEPALHHMYYSCRHRLPQSFHHHDQPGSSVAFIFLPGTTQPHLLSNSSISSHCHIPPITIIAIRIKPWSPSSSPPIVFTSPASSHNYIPPVLGHPFPCRFVLFVVLKELCLSFHSPFDLLLPIYLSVTEIGRAHV